MGARRSPPARIDPVALIEAAYALESGERRWLLGLAESARASLGQRNIGAYALTYDASDVTACRFGELAAVGIESETLIRLLRVEVPIAYRADPAAVEAVLRRTPFGPGHRLPYSGTLNALREALARAGAVDILGLNGINADGRGVHVGLLLPERSRDELPRELLARLSSHLGAAFRLRARLNDGAALERADAVLDVRGRVEHASGAARLREARRALVEAAARIERQRGSVRARDPDRAVAQWTALVDARWSLVDHFERDGRRYLLAHRNDPTLPPFALLTTRERQVVALAAMGHANKMIGYELGISGSTVGVLLNRATLKIGARTRAGLVAAYEEHLRRRRG